MIGTILLNVRSELETKSIAQRMSWVANRKTTRKEDLVYCLLGIFDINMTLLYGEGIQKVFRRLQEEILRKSTDQTILAWACESSQETCALAPHPKYFASCGDLVAVPDLERASELTNIGLKITVRVYENWNRSNFFAILACRHLDDFFNLVALNLSRHRAGHSDSFLRNSAPLSSWPTINLDSDRPKFRTIYLFNSLVSKSPALHSYWLRFRHVLFTGWPIDARIIALPAERWNPSLRTMSFRDLDVPHMSGAFAITMTPAEAQPITFGIVFRVSNDSYEMTVKLFSQPDDNVRSWLDRIESETAGGAYDRISDRLTVGGSVLEVVIHPWVAMGREVIVIQSWSGGNGLLGRNPIFYAVKEVAALLKS